MGEEGVSTCSDATVKVFFLMTMQRHADLFCSALNGQLNSPLLPMPLPLNELRQSATTLLGLLRLSERTQSSFSSAERRLFPCGSCVDSMWRQFDVFFLPPNNGVTQQQPLLQFLGRAAHSRRAVVVWMKHIILTYGSAECLALVVNKGRNK